MKDYFKYKYFFNASHSNNKDKHCHSFAVTLYISKKKENEFLPFFSVDEMMNGYINKYANTYLNDLEVFQGKEPTIENIGEIFYEQLRKILEKKNLELLQLEISETPVRIYIISKCILLPSQYGGDNRRRWEEVIDKKQQFIIRKGGI